MPKFVGSILAGREVEGWERVLVRQDTQEFLHRIVPTLESQEDGSGEDQSLGLALQRRRIGSNLREVEN